jgi:poly(A) polymerase Pap1
MTKTGLTEKKLHQTMSTYKKFKLTKPLWTALTPASENWTMEALISELNNEKLHLEK